MVLAASPVQRARDALTEFFRLESAGGILLVAAAVLALVVANSPLAPLYHSLLDLPVQVRVGRLDLHKPLLLWINDGLMALFFLLVGLELKRELLQGQFADRRQVALPLACAIGGMVVPMAIYTWCNWNDAVALRGAAIPAATDIAFALGVLAMLGSRVPLALKLLLTAIAVADDLGAIVLIALFYTSGLSVQALVLAAVAVAGLFALNRFEVGRLSAYAVVGIVLWIAVLKSGVHATLAGVVIGMSIPLKVAGDPDAHPLETLEHALHPWVAYAILPLFAFANAGVSLQGLSPSSLFEPVPLGIALGLLLGKPIGILLAAALLVATGWVKRPDGVDWSALIGMALLCGIGFTMSLFIGSLAFDASDEGLSVMNRLGILAGSGLSALVGFLVLRNTLPSRSMSPRSE
ncbi:Na+/H+ antiporter NhaA [Arenimonas sp.]|uniref:Na+/H+ antiporter NhaA n=1 Tax=Arenimonas sp. TaxID=1872635 RepID=UPI0039E633E1